MENNGQDLNENDMNNRGNIIPVDIDDQMKTFYIDYSMSVIVGRALPDVRDGLKPVHRRVLYGMNELGNASNKPYKKSARIVGEVMGKYHPHGDSSIYDTMVRMAQDWNMRYTMIDGQGNFGSQDGDPPAAMRYTEVRMDRFAEAMLDDIDKNTVDFQLNFDDSLKEPTVLPTKLPQLLLNGASGIAVGMATNMMPHNLNEVIDGCVAYIENNDIDSDELMKFVKAPDFPTGGIIYGIEGIRQAYRTGRGRVVLRGKVTTEIDNKGREKLVITETPYQVNRDQLTQKIADLINEKVIDGISNVNNESNQKEGTRVVVELKRDAVAQVVENQLYKHTELQTSYGINNVALVRGRPRILNLKDLIAEFVEFRHEIVTRRTQYELDKARERAHILEGYMKVIGTQDDLDRAIKIIRESATPDEARTGLMEAFDLSEIQAKAILELRLRTLTGMEIDKIREEYEAIQKLIAHLENVLADKALRYDIIRKELQEMKDKFGDDRRTTITFADDDINMLDLIPEEDMVVTISHRGYIKRTTTTAYRQQKRGGRGAKGASTRDEDYIEHLFVASTHSTLMFFTEKGRCYWLPVYQINDADKTGKGRPVQNYIQIAGDDKIRAVIEVRDLNNEEFVKSHSLVLCTKNGIINKTALKDFSRPRQSGVNAINVLEGDQLIEAAMTDGNSEILMAVKSGRAIRFHEDKVRVTGRGGIGVRGIEVDNEKDEVVGMICTMPSDENKTILVVSEKGYGKRTNLDDPETNEPVYRITNRGGKGVITIKVTEKTGDLVGMLYVSEDEDLMITCESGITIRTPVKSISVQSRATQGVKLISVSDNDSIAAITNLKEEDEEEDFAEGENSDAPAPTGDAPAETVMNASEKFDDLIGEEKGIDANNDETEKSKLENDDIVGNEDDGKPLKEDEGPDESGRV